MPPARQSREANHIRRLAVADRSDVSFFASQAVLHAVSSRLRVSSLVPFLGQRHAVGTLSDNRAHWACQANSTKTARWFIICLCECPHGVGCKTNRSVFITSSLRDGRDTQCRVKWSSNIVQCDLSTSPVLSHVLTSRKECRTTGDTSQVTFPRQTQCSAPNARP